MRLLSLGLSLPLAFVALIADALGPPKLTHQSSDEVWFQSSDEENFNNKFSLRCQASESPETFAWYKNGNPLVVDGKRIVWQKPSQSGTIIFTDPKPTDEGYYQCFISNIFGTAVSNKVHLQLGVLEHFVPRSPRRLIVDEGESLSVPCDVPHGVPPPTVFWLYRDSQQNSIIETIRRKHIAVDGEGTLQFSAVEPHDGRPTLIYQCAATSAVLHGEYRAGDEVQLIVNTVPALGPAPVRKLWFSPEQVNVKAGSRLKLMCIFGGRPQPVVAWTKIDGELPKKRMKDLTSAESDFGKALIVENVHPDDAGLYECRSQHLFHQMEVTVTAAPFWAFEPPKDADQPEESTAELHCIAAGTPTPLIQWFMNGKPIHEVPDNGRRLILDGGRILRITNLDHDVDTAVYQCNASNPLGYVFANAFVNVRAHAPRFKMPERRMWKVVRKTTVDMSCDVDAAPPAVVRWVNENDQSVAVVPGKVYLFPNHTLRILQVSSTDEGLYYCNVSNKYGINRAYNKLLVFSPTHFVRVPSPKKFSVEAHESLQFFCEAVADPRLTVEYTWTHNGIPINDSEHFIVSNTSLRLINVRGWHSGSIDCVAVTDVDAKMSGIDLSVLDVPLAPNVSEVDCNERRAMIRWRKPNDHGDRITVFLVQMHTSFEQGKWQTVLEEENTARDFYQADITLSPWVTYTFRVIAVNSHGESEPGYKNGAMCVTKPSFPYSNPTEVRVEGDEPNNLVIRWKPMEKFEWNAPDLHYVVRYRLNEQGAQWKEVIIEDPQTNRTIIRDQPTFREYTVHVEAVNRVGKSIIEPPNVIGFSGEDVPLESPSDFTVVEFLNCTTVTVGWKHVKRETVRGHFKGYLIEYWESEKPFDVEKVLVGSDRNDALITDLLPITNYTAKIFTVNVRYHSESHSVMTFCTPEGIPSKVHNLRVRAVGAKSLFVTWEQPLQPNGNVRGYFLTFENSTSGHIEETYVLNRQLYYLHEEAEPDTGYKVSVWAETNGGEGPKVIRPVRTWPLKNPDVPQFKVGLMSPDTILVQWQPSNGSEWAMPGSSFFANYSIAESDVWMESEVISLPKTEVLIRELEEDTEYRISGIARDGYRRTASPELTVRTLSRATITHLSHESLHSAAWFIAILCALLLALVTTFVMCCFQRHRSGKYAVKRKELERGHQLDSDESQNFMEYQYGFK